MGKGKIERSCEVCGKVLYLFPSQIKSGEGRYCSRKCKGLGKKPGTGGQPNEKHVKNGYLWVWAPCHPRAANSRMFEHVLVAEAKLGRYLTEGERVHHLDGNKQNNDPANLQVVSMGEHIRYHLPIRRQVIVTCRICGKQFSTKRCLVDRSKYCSLACRYKGQAATLKAWHKAHKEQRNANN